MPAASDVIHAVFYILYIINTIAGYTMSCMHYSAISSKCTIIISANIRVEVCTVCMLSLSLFNKVYSLQYSLPCNNHYTLQSIIWVLEAIMLCLLVDEIVWQEQ